MHFFSIKGRDLLMKCKVRLVHAVEMMVEGDVCN